MIIQDSFQHASKYSDKAQEFLTRHHIAPSPVNYSVVYLYVSSRSPEINIEIDKRLASDKPMDSVFIDMLFNKYVSHSKSIDNAVLIPFEDSLSDTIDKLNIQVESEQKLAQSLEKADRILSKTDERDSLQNIINYLVGTIAKSQTQHQTLSDQLANTCDEVNQLKSKLEETRKEAVMDSLTGLLNRRGCDDKLKDLDLEDVHSSLAIDIDHFKKINDNFGHFIGDKVIQRVAKVIQSHVSDNDLAVRFGGEEFVVVLVNKTINEAKKAAETIREAISQLKLMQKQSNTCLPPITVSVGITQVDNDHNWTTFFNRADKALYQAKSSGRNCCVAI